MEISTGQSSFLPGKFPLTEALKDPVRALDPLPRGALTVCPITPCPPWAGDLNLALVNSEPDRCHQAGHLQLTTDGCCALLNPQSSRNSGQGRSRIKSKPGGLVFRAFHHLPSMSLPDLPFISHWSTHGAPTSSHTSHTTSPLGAGPASCVLGSHQLSLSKFKPSLQTKLVSGKRRLQNLVYDPIFC